MSRRPDSGARSRWGYLAGLAGTVSALILGAAVAYAAVSDFSPDNGTVSPGGSTTTNFTLTPPSVLGITVASCVTASVSPSPAQFTVAFDGLGLGVLPANCALTSTQVEMTVSAGANATPGDYVVTVREAKLDGGSVVSLNQWPFTVLAPPTTTSTSSSTTSTTAPTTTSTSTPVTTSSVATTTSTAVTGGPTTSAPATDNGTAPPEASNGGASQAAPPPGSTTSSTAPTTTATTPPENEADGIVVAAPGPQGPTGSAGGGVGIGETPGQDDEGFLSNISLSEQLRNQIARAIPLPVAQAVLSPLVIAEFLFRSVLGSTVGYLIPLLIATAFGLWLVLRMRREVDDDELALSTQPLV